MAQLQFNPDAGRYEALYDGRAKEFADPGEEAITSVASWAIEEAIKAGHSAEEVLDPEFWNNVLDEQIARIDFRPKNEVRE